jgi:hypothetical protein
MALLPSIRPAEIPVRVKFSMFFDKAGVAAGISKAKRAGLYKAGSVVMQAARRSIRKMGSARPKLKVEKVYSKMALQEIVKLKGATAERLGVLRDSRGRFLVGSGGISSRDGLITETDRQRVRELLFEMKYKPPSAPGNPPHTHGAQAQLRRSITYGYDASTESVVIGGFMPGIEKLVSLHEFGGSQKMAPWAWVPDKFGRGYSGIIGWWAVGRAPRSRRWTPLTAMKPRHFIYPKRPYMRPALKKSVDAGKISEAFGNSFTMTGRPGT